MFSVDNFYTVFNSYYGRPENNLLYIFDPHGSKDWTDLSYSHCNLTDSCLTLPKGKWIMHDQEPFFKELVSDYLRKIQDESFFTNLKSINQNKYTGNLYMHDLAQYLDWKSFFYFRTETLSVPILCHSQKNCKDIEELEKSFVVTCYYWWHGMVARDWFRHWERHAELVTYNKSRADYRFLLYARAFDGTRTYRSDLVQHLHKNPSQVLYNHNNQELCPTLSATIDIEDANKSAIHIVAETLFDSEKLYLTEKVFKPMVMCQPFILFGPANSLQYLRDYGFKTFGNLWDESYDLILDANERKHKLFQLIDQLSSLNEREFAELYQRMLPIIKHNREWFFSVKFQDLLWNEMQRNCSEALLKKRELSEQLYGGTWCYGLNQLIESGHFEKIPQPWINDLNTELQIKNLNQEKLIQTYPLFKKII